MPDIDRAMILQQTINKPGRAAFLREGKILLSKKSPFSKGRRKIRIPKDIETALTEALNRELLGVAAGGRIFAIPVEKESNNA